MRSVTSIKRLIRWAWLLGALYCASVPGATRIEVILVANEQLPVHRELIQAVRETLEKRGAVQVNLSVQPVSYFRPQGRHANDPWPDLIVTSGTVATERISRRRVPVPVLSVLPRLSFEEIQRRMADDSASHDGNFSALYLDQPLARQFDLIRQALPRARHVGVVLGPSSKAYERELTLAAEQRKLDLRLGHVATEDKLIATLDRVLTQSDVMLGVVDPLVFSRTSAQSVLLTAYRRRVPLIGISSAYVNAGALAAVYSTPAQIGRQLAEMIEQFSQNPAAKLPPPQYPKYFSVAVNYQAAEVLGLDIDDEDSLKRRLSSRREEQP